MPVSRRDGTTWATRSVECYPAREESTTARDSADKPENILFSARSQT